MAKAKKNSKLPNLVLRGQRHSGPNISFKKSEDYGYEIYRKFFLKDPVLVGTVSEDCTYALWCAFKWEPELIARGKRTKVYVKGGKSRKLAVRALLALMGMSGGL